MVLPVALLEVLHGASLPTGLESTPVTTAADPEAPPEQDRPAFRRTSARREPRSSPDLPSARSCAGWPRSRPSLTIDVCGLALGLYLALVLRWLFYEHAAPSGASPGRRRSSGSRSSTLITMLVFWRAGSTPSASSRGGRGPRRLVARARRRDHARFAVGADHQFRTFGLSPTAFVTCVGDHRRPARELRASSRGTSCTCSEFGAAPCSSARASRSSTCCARSAETRGGIDYEFLGAIVADADGIADRRGSAARRSAAACSTARRVDELIVNGGDVSDEQLLELVEQAHRAA